MLQRAFIAAFFALGLLAAGVPVQAACSEERVDLRGDWGQARFRVEIADTDALRAQGLMNRENLARSAGMLFIFEAPTSPSFWMRNTLIPLDMIFVDPTGAVTHIHQNAVPHDTTPIPGGDNVLMVLEINGGLSEAMGIDVGSQLRHPRLDDDIALWGCSP